MDSEMLFYEVLIRKVVVPPQTHFTCTSDDHLVQLSHQQFWERSRRTDLSTAALPWTYLAALWVQGTDTNTTKYTATIRALLRVKHRVFTKAAVELGTTIIIRKLRGEQDVMQLTIVGISI